MKEMAQVIGTDLNSSPESDSKQASHAAVSVLQFEDDLSQRAVAMDLFRGEAEATSPSPTKPSLRILLSTDLAARGLDIVDITHIIHFDLPPDADTYTHRAGRAGRFGRTGQIVSVIPPEQEFVLQRLANKLNLELRCIGRQKSDI